jgi:hypothetical protein
MVVLNSCALGLAGLTTGMDNCCAVVRLTQQQQLASEASHAAALATQFAGSEQPTRQKRGKRAYSKPQKDGATLALHDSGEGLPEVTGTHAACGLSQR